MTTHTVARLPLAKQPRKLLTVRQHGGEQGAGGSGATNAMNSPLLATL